MQFNRRCSRSTESVQPKVFLCQKSYREPGTWQKLPTVRYGRETRTAVLLSRKTARPTRPPLTAKPRNATHSRQLPRPAPEPALRAARTPAVPVHTLPAPPARKRAQRSLHQRLPARTLQRCARRPLPRRRTWRTLPGRSPRTRRAARAAATLKASTPRQSHGMTRQGRRSTPPAPN